MESEVGSLTEKFPRRVLERSRLALNFQTLGVLMMRKDRTYQQTIGYFPPVVISELSNFSFPNPLPVTHMFPETFRMPVNFKKGKAWVQGGCSLW